MRRRKAHRKALACLVSFILLAGCGKTGVFDGFKVANEDAFRMEYTILNREETADLTLREGDRLRVELAHEGGSVDVRVGQEGKAPIYTGAEQVDAEFELIIPETGTYRIAVNGHRARGRAAFVRRPETAEQGE